MKYSLQILKKQNFFQETQISFPNALNIRYIWTLIYNYWGFGGITNLPNP